MIDQLRICSVVCIMLTFSTLTATECLSEQIPLTMAENNVYDYFSLLPKLKKRMIGDLEIIKNTFEIKYAPSDWKKNYAAWNLEEQLENAIQAVQNKEIVTIDDFHHIVRSFLYSSKDYHVSPFFYSTEFSYLPFKVRGVDGRYFVVSTNPSSPLYVKIPVNIGDEIVSFDGKKCHEAILEIKERELGKNNPQTDHALAEGLLTTRLGMIGHQIPKGRVVIDVLPKDSTHTVTYTPEWEHHPERIKKSFFPELYDYTNAFDEESILSEHPFFKKMMCSSFAGPLMEAFSQIDGSSSNIEPKGIPQELFGESIDQLPSCNTIIYQPATNYFKAYIYSTPSGQKIAYIRLPTFHAGYPQIQEFASLIAVFQNMSDALIINQTNNPGGYFFYMYALASLLTDKPLKTPMQRQTITQEDVSFALKYLSQLENVKTIAEAKAILGSTLQGLPVNLNLVKNFIDHFRFIINEWEEGRYLTQPSHLYCLDEIKPHPKVCYTKPILVLVNCLDFSCADFFPAILQDNKRAIIMGERTAGAGGFVLKQSYPNLFGIAGFSYTGSIAQRSDNNPIENLGITPDIDYKLTVNDLKNNFADYHAAIQAVIDSLLKPN